eukprot:PITA_15547
MPPKDEILAQKEEPQEVVEQPQIVEQRVETFSKAKPLEKQRRSPERYTGDMALMTELIEIEPSYFEEEIEKPVWVDAIVEEYESIAKNCVWEKIPRTTYNSIVGLRCIFKVKQTTNKRIGKYNARFVAKGYSQVEGIDYEETFSLVVR